MRFVSLIRHGEYEPTPDGGVLTARGRRQASATGKRLAALGVDAIYCSTLSRAIESAERISEKTRVKIKPAKDYLQESWPTGVTGYHVPLEKRRIGRRRVETIALKHLKRSKRTVHDVIVCHGNIIRALVAEALDVRMTTWTRMFIHHGSISQLVVTDSGRVALRHFNDIGHFTPSLVSHSLTKTKPQ